MIVSCVSILLSSIIRAIPVKGCPSCLQATVAALSSQPESPHTAPQRLLLHTSTRLFPPSSRMSPCVLHRSTCEETNERYKTYCKHSGLFCEQFN